MHMEKEILEKLAAQEKLIEATYISTEKMRKYFLWTLIISVAMIVLPLIGLAFAIPQFIKTIGGGLNINGLGL